MDLVTFDSTEGCAVATVALPAIQDSPTKKEQPPGNYTLRNFLCAHACCSCDRSLRGNVCAHHLLVLCVHFAPTDDADALQLFTTGAMRFFGTTFGSDEACSSAAGIRPFTAWLADQHFQRPQQVQALAETPTSGSPGVPATDTSGDTADAKGAVVTSLGKQTSTPLRCSSPTLPKSPVLTPARAFVEWSKAELAKRSAGDSTNLLAGIQSLLSSYHPRAATWLSLPATCFRTKQVYFFTSQRVIRYHY